MVDLQIAGNSKNILLKYRDKIMTSMSQTKIMIPEHRWWNATQQIEVSIMLFWFQSKVRNNKASSNTAMLHMKIIILSSSIRERARLGPASAFCQRVVKFF